METSPGSEYPRLCAEVGLSCEECTCASATELARACKGLRGKMIGQMFVQIYPHAPCSKMHGHFAEVYREVSSKLIEMETPRKSVESERRVMVAVA